MSITDQVMGLIPLCTYDRPPGCTYGPQVLAHEND